MKKLVSVILAMAFVVSLVPVGTAIASGPRKNGSVTTIDEKAGTATFMFEGEDEAVTLAVEADELKGIKEGDDVKVSFEDEDCKVIDRVKKDRSKSRQIPQGC